MNLLGQTGANRNRPVSAAWTTRNPGGRRKSCGTFK
jgi:hypothetical protein